jgi:hypothetical protein
MQWYPGSAYHRLNDPDNTYYTFFWAEAPARPSNARNEKWYVLKTQSLRKAVRISTHQLEVVVYRPKTKESVAYVDLYKFPYGDRIFGISFPVKGRTDEELIQTAQDYALNQMFSPMELFSMSMNSTVSAVSAKENPFDLKGRKIPARYLKGLPKQLKERRVQELTQSRDAYSRGDYSELPTDRAARKLGLVKKSAY